MVDFYDAIIRQLDSPLIIIGHSFGGLMTQILLDRGLGAAGVAISSARKEHHFLPFSTIKVAFPTLRLDVGEYIAVVGRTAGTVRQNGAAFNTPLVHLRSVKDGKIASLTVLLDHPCSQCCWIVGQNGIYSE